MNRLSCLLPPIILLFSACFAGAQLVVPPYRHLTLRDGLPQMQVMSLFQDSRGMVWVGTKAGAAYHNGQHFGSLTVKDGLASDFILVFAEDLKGNIWMGTHTGLACYDGSSVVAYNDPDLHVASIAPAPDGKIWFYGNAVSNGYNPTLFGYLEKGEYHYLPVSPIDAGSTEDPELAIMPGDDRLLIKLQHHIYMYGEGKIKRLYSTSDTLKLIRRQGQSPLVMKVNTINEVELLTVENGEMMTKARYIFRKNVSGPFFDEEFHTRINMPGWPFIRITPDSLVDMETYGLQMNFCLADREGQIWIGSEEGVYRISDNGFETFESVYLPQVWGITQDLQGNMWFASYTFGLKMYDNRQLHEFQELKERKLPEHFYFQPSVDDYNRLFFPSAEGMLVRSGGKFSLLVDKGVISSYYDPQRKLLLAGMHKKVRFFDEKLQHAGEVGQSGGQEFTRWVVALGSDTAGWYWLGTLNELLRYNYDTKESKLFAARNGLLPADGILSLHTDRHGRTWMGSTHGLLYFDAVENRIVKVENDLLTGAVNLVATIDTSWLIASQPHGLYLMDLGHYYRTGKVRLSFFNENNGYRGIEPGQNGAFKDASGNLWVTSSTEVVKITPHKLKTGKYALSVRFKSCNAIALPYGAEGTRLKKNRRTAVVTFDAVCFNRPGPVQYSWRLGESDKDWSEWQNEDYAVINDLPGGRSVIELRARIPGLPLDEYPTTKLSVETVVALWRQPWFFPGLFVFFALLGLIALYLLFRTRVRMLQAVQAARISQMQAIQSQMNPHFIFNVLAALQSMILNADPERANHYLVRLASLIRGLLNASISSGSSRIEKAMVPLQNEIEMLENYVSFQQLIHPGRFVFRLEMDDKLDPAHISVPPLLIQPFVENAIRHGLLPKEGPGLLMVKIEAEGKTLLITVSDDGVGMHKAAVMMEQSQLRYTSHGRELTLDRARLMTELGYPIEITTQSSNKGTTVTIKLSTYGE